MLDKALEQEAMVTFIMAGVQIVNDHVMPLEKFEWKNKKKLFDLLYKHRLSNVILLSGDVHFAAVALPPCGLFTPDFTSSGLTHAIGYVPFGHETVSLFQSALYGSTIDPISSLNYGFISI
jgi:hypothetical protein